MKVLLNFLPLKQGGGVQVGLDFLEQIRRHGQGHEWFLVASEGTPFVNLRPIENLELVRIVRRGIFARALFEYREASQLIKAVMPDVIYTQFGPQWPNLPVPQVVGCAYSHLFYPEVDFWVRLPFFRRLAKKVIDRFRMHRLRHADVIIFETPELGRRARRQLGDTYDIRVVLPSPSAMVGPIHLDKPFDRQFVQRDARINVLMLSGYHPNKNIELLPKVAERFLKSGLYGDLRFVLTLPTEHPGVKNLMDDIARRGVTDMFTNVGPVAQRECKFLYSECDVVILPSRLESFSNNIAESWILRRPLLISDHDWSRDICGEGALYFQYDDEVDAYEKLRALILDVGLRDELIARGSDRLRHYPTGQERFRQYLKIFEEQAGLGRGGSNPVGEILDSNAAVFRDNA